MAATKGTPAPPEEPSGAPLLWGWIAFGILLVGTAVLDNLVISKPDDKLPPSCSRILRAFPVYARQICFWVLSAILFNLYVLSTMGNGEAWAWLYGYVLEYILSIDNLFVFQAVFRSYSTPPAQVERALFWGVSAAVALRLAFFAIGTEILQLGFLARAVFGLALIYSGVKTLRSSDDDEEDPTKNPVVQCVARLLPMHESYADEPLFFIRATDQGEAVRPRVLGASLQESPELGMPADPSSAEVKSGTVQLGVPEDVEVRSQGNARSGAGSLRVTPLFLVVVTLGIIDVIFAVDSVTAKISSVSNLSEGLSFFLNLSSSAFAMFVLRSLYTVVSILSSMFHYLGYGVGIVLILIGIKLMLAGWVEIGMRFSFLAIVSILLVSILASVLMPKKDDDRPSAGTQLSQVSSEGATS